MPGRRDSDAAYKIGKYQLPVLVWINECFFVKRKVTIAGTQTERVSDIIVVGR